MYVGLTGLMCQNFSINSHRFTPRWVPVETTSYGTLTLYIYTGYLDAPFYENSLGGVFLSSPRISVNSPEVLEFYECLPTAVTQLVEAVVRDTIDSTGTYCQVRPEWTDEYPIHRHYSQGIGIEDDDEHPFGDLAEFLPRPFAAVGDHIVVDEADLPENIDHLLTLADGVEDIHQTGLDGMLSDSQSEAEAEAEAEAGGDTDTARDGLSTAAVSSSASGEDGAPGERADPETGVTEATQTTEATLGRWSE
jgi:hypothetical protein